MSDGRPIYQVDAFTSEPYHGNPAAVVPLNEAADEDWMQLVAREMNLSETAFLHPEGEAWRLRWFTPTAEVDLCGHATLASAHVLWTTGRAREDTTIPFATLSGELAARPLGHGWTELDLPNEAPEPVEAPPGLAKLLGAPPVSVHRNRLDLVVELADEATVHKLTPRTEAFPEDLGRGVIVTAAAEDEDLDYVCRYFAPAYGIPEDPVTGSAQCALAPFWAKRLDTFSLEGAQVSARGGRFRCRITDERVKVAGQAVTVLEGRLVV